jgi:beta-glucanase (GH16 family)/Ca2+-binding RTX toxin-like protein
MYLKYDGSVALESGANNGVNLWSSGPNQTLQGSDLNDVLGGSGQDTLIGGLGDNQYYLSGWNTIVQGPTGVNTVTTWMSYALPDNIQNLYVSGDGLYAAGNSLDNLITVGDTNAMQLYGAAGNNVLVGGAGTDTFIVDGTAGSNAIYNWHSGDQVRLLGGAFTSFGQVQAAMTQQGSDVVLHNGQNDLVIRNATVGQFQAADFQLALDHAQLGGLSFDDEFNSLSLYNGTSGTWTPHYWYGGVGAYTLPGNGELQLYTAPGFTGTGTTDLGLNPFSVSNGVLDIHAQTVTADQSAAMWNYQYSSGVITTKDTFAQTYGYFEMRAELPTDVSGAWPAFWLVPADGSWPPELDVMETLTGSSNIDYTTVHSEAAGYHTAVGAANLVTNVGGFHTYGVLWTASDITWYLDGQAVFETATPADMHQPMYMIANMAIGGWAGTPDFTSTDMKVDYIRAYGLADGSSTWTSSVTPDAPSSSSASTSPGGSSSTDGASPPSTGSSSTGTDGSSTPTTDGSSTGSSSTTTDGSSASGGSGVAAAAVSIADASYAAPAGVTNVTLTGSWQTVHGNDAGDTFVVANNTGNAIIGGAGNDTFYMGRGGDWVSGGGGHNIYVFDSTPWVGAHIQDFNPAHDTIDLSGLLARSGYSGTDPVGDGYIKITADAAGNAQIWSDLDQVANAGWWLVTTLDGVSSSSIGLQGDIVTAAAAVNPQVAVSDASYTAPAGVTTITLTGAWQTVHGNDAGDTFIVANSTGNALYGGAGNDTFYMGRNGDWAAGGGGSDTFVFQATPWKAGGVTDFGPGDKIDLTGLLAHAGYTGSDPVGAGYLKITDDGQGDAQIWSNLNATWWQVTTLDHVAAASLHVSGAFITG